MRFVGVADEDVFAAFGAQRGNRVAIARAFHGVNATYFGELADDFTWIAATLCLAVEEHDRARNGVADHPNEVGKLVAGEEPRRAHQHDVVGAARRGMTRQLERLNDAAERGNDADPQ